MKILHTVAFLLLSLPLARAQDTPVPYPTDPTPWQPVQKPFAAPDVPKLGSTPIQKPNVGKVLPQAKAVSPITPFMRDVLFRWNQPNGETMKTMLRQIQEAEKSGDTATYNRLVETYRTWAEKYLVRGAEPDNTQKP